MQISTLPQYSWKRRCDEKLQSFENLFSMHFSEAPQIHFAVRFHCSKVPHWKPFKLPEFQALQNWQQNVTSYQTKTNKSLNQNFDYSRKTAYKVFFFFFWENFGLVISNAKVSDYYFYRLFKSDLGLVLFWIGRTSNPCGIRIQFSDHVTLDKCSLIGRIWHVRICLIQITTRWQWLILFERAPSKYEYERDINQFLFR